MIAIVNMVRGKEDVNGTTHSSQQQIPIGRSHSRYASDLDDTDWDQLIGDEHTNTRRCFQGPILVCCCPVHVCLWRLKTEGEEEEDDGEEEEEEEDMFYEVLACLCGMRGVF